MKEITTRYNITLDGVRHEYTDTYEAQDIRDAHYMIMYHWQGVDKLEFISDEVKEEV